VGTHSPGACDHLARTARSRIAARSSSFPCSTAGRFLVPTCGQSDAARRRRQGWPSLQTNLQLTAARPHLDGAKRGVMLSAVGPRTIPAAASHNGCYNSVRGAVGRAKPPARHFDVAQVLRGVPAVRLSAGNGASFSAFRQHTRVRLLPALVLERSIILASFREEWPSLGGRSDWAADRSDRCPPKPQGLSCSKIAIGTSSGPEWLKEPRVRIQGRVDEDG
jgi:hypothetical protein